MHEKWIKCFNIHHPAMVSNLSGSLNKNEQLHVKHGMSQQPPKQKHIEREIDRLKESLKTVKCKINSTSVW